MAHPTVSEVMTPSPATAVENELVLVARERMEQQQCRHLPVLRDEVVVGILSARDLEVLRAIANRGLDRLIVSDVMVSRPYVALLDTPLVDVLAEMEQRKLGATIVIGPYGSVAGIFTAIDALRLLRRLIATADRAAPYLDTSAPRSRSS
jgi:CBS domain-containing protein